MNKDLKILLGLSALGLLAYSEKQRKNDSPPVFFKKSLPGNYNGFIIPPFGIFITERNRNNVKLMEHEMVHWKQFQREGLIKFIIGYSIEAITKGYDKNKYEVEARFNEDDPYCVTNNTECVRTGRSIVVNNPNFRKS
jgi:hypothetical protein